LQFLPLYCTIDSIITNKIIDKEGVLVIDRKMLVKKIEELPLYLLEEVANYISYVEYKKAKEDILKTEEITLASEKSLSKDWLKPEEDEAWKDL